MTKLRWGDHCALSGSALNTVTCVLLIRDRGRYDRRGEDHVTTEAEIGMTQP